jgi:uncharacterized membrane protein YeaQ/YmgE (transglycosylase-associated protein family)
MMGSIPFLLESSINPYIWCVVGALIGAAASFFAAGQGRIVMIENVLVGVFGSFIGGDFVAAMISGSKVVNDKDFRVSSLGMAVAGAVVMLVVLRLMRGAVGPMRASKSKAGRHS